MKNRFTGFMILGVSLILSSACFGIFFYQSRIPEKTIRVVGAATKRFDSDIIKWRITIFRNTGLNNLQEGYARIKDDMQSFVALMRENGIPAKDITVQPVNANPVYSQYEKGGNPSGYSITQSAYLISRDLDKVEALALNPSLLAERGILLQSSNLEYYFSKLSTVKKEMLAAATLDARERATEIAKSSGNRITKIESARVGVFQITEPYSTEVSDYGIYNTATRRKDITVTINVVFSIK